ncbi:MAG: hypothetical protein V4580_00665 [Bacteroidota bacterium]
MPCFSVTKKTETDAAQISLCSDGIIRVMIKKDIEITPGHFKILFETYNELVQGKKHPFIYYAEEGSSTVSDDGRAYAKASEHLFPKVCNAVVVTRLAHKLLANFYFKFNKPSYPFKVFTRMDEAEKWCLEQLAASQKTADLSLQSI